MSSNQFNFSLASEHDEIVYGACRPGASQPASHETGDAQVGQAEVQQWVGFMKEQGVTRVVNLLDDEKEIQAAYSCDLPAIMKEEFKEFHNISGNQPGAAEKVVKVLEDAAAANEKVVVHCWQGQGRTGNALASWLVQQHHLPPAEAAEKVLEAARAADASRRVNVAKLQEFADAQATKP